MFTCSPLNPITMMSGHDALTNPPLPLPQPYVDFFTHEKMIHPLSNAPEPKSRFIPSKWEAKRVSGWRGQGEGQPLGGRVSGGGGAASWRKGVWWGEGQPLGGRVSDGGGCLVGGGAASWRKGVWWGEGQPLGGRVSDGGGCLVGGGAASWRKGVWWGEGQPLGGRVSGGGEGQPLGGRVSGGGRGSLLEEGCLMGEGVWGRARREYVWGGGEDIVSWLLCVY